MLYVTEVPVHFGLVISVLILLVLGFLLTIQIVLKSEGFYRTMRAFLVISLFCLIIGFGVISLSFYSLPALATVEQMLLYNQLIWAFFGLHAFFLWFYFWWQWFNDQKWRMIIPIIFTGIFLVLAFILPTPLTTYTVSDGVANYLVMPLALVTYGGSLTVWYLLLVPLISSYTLANKREGKDKTWTWVSLFGFVLWAVAVMLMAMVGFLPSSMLIAFGLSLFAWLLLFIAGSQIELPTSGEPE